MASFLLARAAPVAFSTKKTLLYKPFAVCANEKMQPRRDFHAGLFCSGVAFVMTGVYCRDRFHTPVQVAMGMIIMFNATMIE